MRITREVTMTKKQWRELEFALRMGCAAHYDFSALFKVARDAAGREVIAPSMGEAK